MRISDWSSDVCSSDLDGSAGRFQHPLGDNSVDCRSAAKASIAESGFPNSAIYAAANSVLLPVRQLSEMPRQLCSCRQAALEDSSARSEEHTSELQSLMRISYAVFCLKKKKNHTPTIQLHNIQH